MKNQKLKTFQQWCIDTLCMILQAKKQYRGNLSDQGYIYTIRSIVDHYASMYYCGQRKTLCRNKEKEHINLWWDHLNRSNREAFFAPLLMSKNAFHILASTKNNKKLGEQNGLLRLEHITPKSYVCRKLLQLKPITYKKIVACFKHCKLVLITREESKCLDGKDAEFTKKDISTLCRVYCMDDDSITEATQLIGKSSKSNGSGLLRLVRLHNSGVRFCNAQGKQMGLGRCLAYFEAENYDFYEHLKT